MSVSAQVLAMMRSAGAGFLTDSCIIERKSQTSEDGYLKPVWSVVAAAAPCRLLPDTRQDSKGEVEDREAGRVYYKLSLAHNADLADGDRVKIGGLIYEVLQIMSSLTDAVFKSAKCVRIEA